MSYLVIRAVHTWAVAILLGGTALMSVVVCASRKSGREDWDQDTITMIRIVEWIFWSVLGIVVFSGAGNLGAFGEGLPDHNMLWGHVFLFKLGGYQDPLPGFFSPSLGGDREWLCVVTGYGSLLATSEGVVWRDCRRTDCGVPHGCEVGAWINDTHPIHLPSSVLPPS